MTVKLLVLVGVAHLGMALLDLPPLWRSQQRRGERWAVMGLLLAGLFMAVMVILDYTPFSAYDLIEAIFKPVGTLLFKIKEG